MAEIPHKRTKDKVQRHSDETEALLEASRAVLKYREFKDTARAIFDSCRKLTGAISGYVALLSEDGNQNEVLFLDAGGLPCTVNPSLPMPIRGLRAMAYTTCKTVYDNNFSDSEWMEYMPEGHVILENVMFAPLVIDGKSVGLLGLANKQGGFTENDARIASAFGDLAAIALLNSKLLTSLKEEKDRAQRYFDIAGTILVVIDTDGKVSLINKKGCDVLGYKEDEIADKNWFDNFLPENLRYEVKTIFTRLMAGEIEPVEYFENPVLTKGGKERFIAWHNTVMKDEAGNIIGTLSSGEDITERKLTEERIIKQHAELEKKNLELSTLFKISSAISRTIDINDLFSSILHTITELEMLKVEHKGGIFIVEGDNMTLISHLGHPESFLDKHKGMKVGDCLCGLAARTGEIIISKNSDWDNRHTITYPDNTPHGHIIIPLKVSDRVVGVLYLYMPVNFDIDEKMMNTLITIGNQIGMAISNSMLYEQTKMLSLYDPLTKAANRNLMNVELEKNFARAKRLGSAFSVIMLDIDNFKKFNDTFGHTAGDNLLVEIANVLMNEVRTIDLIVRFGGEEFLILLPDTEPAVVFGVAERIRKAVETKTAVTISLGISSYEKGMHKREDLIKKADDALYQAKQNGKNRVEVSE